MKDHTDKIKWLLYAPFYTLLLSLLLFESRTFSEAEGNPLNLLNLNRVVGIIASISFIFVFFTNRGKINISIPISLKIYGLYIITAIISTLLFSDWMLYSLWKLAEITAVFLLAIYLWNLSNRHHTIVKRFYEGILSFYKFLLIVTVINIIALPSQSIQSISVYSDALLPFQIQCIIPQINPNSLGLLSSIVLYVSLIRFIKSANKKFLQQNLIWGVVAFSLMIFAQSRTATLGFFTAFSLSLILFVRLHFFLKGVMYLVLSLSIYLYLPYIILYLKRGTPETLITKMSGRVPMWEFAINCFSNSDLINKVLGSGFAISNRLILQRFSSDASTLHSDYIDALISTGIIGVIFLLLFVIITLFKATLYSLRNKANSIYVEQFGVCIILVIRTITGSTISLLSLFLPLFMIIPIYLARMNKMFNKFNHPKIYP